MEPSMEELRQRLIRKIEVEVKETLEAYSHGDDFILNNNNNSSASTHHVGRLEQHNDDDDKKSSDKSKLEETSKVF